MIQTKLKMIFRKRLQVDDDEPVCARDKWTLKINEEEMVCASKVQKVGTRFKTY